MSDANANKGCSNPAFPVRSGALCYPACKTGYHNVGPVCWQDLPPGSTDQGAFFTVEKYGRGVGTPLVCKPEEENHAGLCYPKTPEGWKHIGGIIYKNCPAEFRNDGLYCGKPKAYGRGAGSTNEQKCMNSHQGAACEKWGLLWYPKCKEGFKSIGCCTCTPACPEGYTDIGVSCKKPSRSVKPKPISTCPPDREKSGALCYKKCREGFKAGGAYCHKPCEPGRFNGTTCQRASYPNTAGRPLQGTGIIFIIIVAALVLIGLRIAKAAIFKR